MSFKDKSFADRFGAMGDQSESAFEQWCEQQDQNYIRWGLDRPPLKMSMLPARLRYSPDYLMSAKFVECQGFGRDQTFKLKVEKHGALHWWNDLHPVDLWVLDSHHDRACLISLLAIDELLNDPNVTIESFPEGKAYFAIPADVIFEQSGARICNATPS